jgi:hypothetical protein
MIRRFRNSASAAFFLLAAAAPALQPEPGDRATYDIFLFGTRIGRQTVEVTAETQTTEGPAYRVVAVTETLPWVARIYRLRDVVTTTVLSSRHRPIASHIDIREGSYTNTVSVEVSFSPREMRYSDSRGRNKTRVYRKPLLDAVSLIFYFAGKRPEKGKTVEVQAIEGDRIADKKVRFAGEDKERDGPPSVLFEEIGGREVRVWYPAKPIHGRYFPYAMVLARIKLKGYPITSLRAEIVPEKRHR